MTEFELVDCGEFGLSIREKLKDGEYRMTDVVKQLTSKTKIKKLNSEAFTFDTHIWDNDVISTKQAIGYTESERVRFRPQEHNYAVMFFDEDIGNYWFHIPECVFEKLFICNDKNKGVNKIGKKS